jgi:hypothetical protein
VAVWRWTWRRSASRWRRGVSTEVVEDTDLADLAAAAAAAAVSRQAQAVESCFATCIAAPA